MLRSRWLPDHWGWIGINHAFATSKHEWNEHSRHWIKVYLRRVLLALSHICRTLVPSQHYDIICLMNFPKHPRQHKFGNQNILAAIKIRFVFLFIRSVITSAEGDIDLVIRTHKLSPPKETSWLTNVVQTLSETSKRIYPATLQTVVDDTPQNVSCNSRLARLHPRWITRLRIVSL